MTALPLRDRQRLQVATEIRAAAYRLFLEHGFEAVTTAQIAEAAGVSQRTLFRHIASKDDLVLAPLRSGGRAIVRHLEERPPEEPADQALAAAIVSRVATFTEPDSAEWRRIVLTTNLLERVSLLTHEDRKRVIDLIAQRMRTDPAAAPRPQLLVHLAFAAADFGFQQWVRQPSSADTSLVQWVSQSLDAVTGPHWSPEPRGSRTPAS